ncbi:hypothetical protein [Streptomyces sp. I05A-00742]|uniref:hypothetical protein n=1 Tax=Streptomyces sp. I05A-00742 TaxID=2732853 RepID=UPI001488F653|nr:hypothetical protein [Streptomyces sp. I05A-00742]
MAFPSRYRDPEPFPLDFTQGFGTQAKQQGVYLHWHLPAALGRGRADLSAGRAAPLWYPPVPNRWLVLRHFRPDGTPAGAAPQTTGWLVYSDYCSDRNKAKGGGTSRVAKDRWMGRSVSLDGTVWSEQTGPWCSPLTALGPGLPSFAAFQPYCEDVFSFHDPLTDSGGTPAALGRGNLGYLLAGWHTAPADDPLDTHQVDRLLDFFGDPRTTAEERARHALNRLGWHLADPPPLTGGERSVYAGTVLGLFWDKDADRPPRSRKPDGHQDVKLAVGHDMADAMAALVRDSLPAPGLGDATAGRPDGDATADHPDADVTAGHPDNTATVPFHAFHTGHLSTLDRAVDEHHEAELLRAATHENWFAPTPRGTRWKVTRVQDASPPRLDEAPSPERDEDLVTRLAGLNTAQHALDVQQCVITSLLRHTAELWWLHGLYAEARDKPVFDDARCAEAIDPERSGPAQDLRAAVATAAGLRGAVDRARVAVEAVLPKGYTLTGGAAAPFHEPADPTLLIRGAGTPLSDSLGKNAALPCRAPLALLTTASVRAQGSSPGFTATAPAPPPLPPQWDKATDGLPEPVRSALKGLAGELYVLHAIVHHLQQTDEARLKRGTRLSDSDRVASPPKERWPVTDVVWEQPWRPLTLAWQAECHTLPFDGPGPVWDFDGSRRHLHGVTAATGHFQFQGRSLISAVPVTTLQRRIDAHLDTYPDRPGPDFEEFRRLAGTWNLASQRLTGLRAALARRCPASTTAGPPAWLAPLPPTAPDPGSGAYQPVPAVHFRLRRLNIVDSFGRGVLVVDEGNEHNYRTHRADSVTPDHPVLGQERDAYRYVELGPRLGLPAALCLTPLSRTATTTGLDKVVDTDSDPYLTQDTPVAGWLVVRRTGTGQHPSAHWALAVYGPEGRALGEVRRLAGPAADGSRDAVTWLPLPDSPCPTPRSLREAAFAATHPALAGFLAALVDEDPDAIAAGTAPGTDRPARLDDLASSVDTALMATAHHAGTAAIGAGLAAGRALALVRLRLHLELDGTPLTDPHWNSVFDSIDTTDPHYRDRRWPVRLGTGGDRTDGLVGYYTGPADRPGDTDYATFHAVHSPHSPAGHYTTPILDGSDLAVPARPAATTVDPHDAAYFTALLDPRVSLSAHTDIQPVLRWSLPPATVEEHLARLTLAVPLGPVLARTLPASTGPTTVPGPPRLTLPTPDATGDWGFATPARPTPDVPDPNGWDHYALAAGTFEARLEPATPDARSGYLTLGSRPAPPPEQPETDR